MTRLTFAVPNAPKPGGPYSANSRIGDIVAIAGQCGYLQDRSLANGCVEQTRVALRNLAAALEAAGAREADVIATGVFISDADLFDEMNSVYKDFFTDPQPARTTIVAGLRPGVLFEINATAVLQEKD